MKPFIDPYEGSLENRPHPAKFSDCLLPVIKELIPEGTEWITDPMAGIGKITLLGSNFKYQCNEIEPEWASQIKAQIVTAKDAKALKLVERTVIITSPPYGNRMADCFITKRPSSMKGRYAGDLGRRLSEGSSASLAFGNKYKALMTEIYTSLFEQMNEGQVFILNASNFIRDKKEVNVIGFYLELFSQKGFTLDDFKTVKTPRDRGRGANSKLRVSFEVLMKWRKLNAL